MNKIEKRLKKKKTLTHDKSNLKQEIAQEKSTQFGGWS